MTNWKINFLLNPFLILEGYLKLLGLFVIIFSLVFPFYFSEKFTYLIGLKEIGKCINCQSLLTLTSMLIILFCQIAKHFLRKYLDFPLISIMHFISFLYHYNGRVINIFTFFYIFVYTMLLRVERYSFPLVKLTFYLQFFFITHSFLGNFINSIMLTIILCDIQSNILEYLLCNLKLLNEIMKHKKVNYFITMIKDR